MIKSVIWYFKILDVKIEYNMSEIILIEIKYCFSGIIKEVLSNAVKYSDATQTKIIMWEHLTMYQLCIADNEKGDPKATVLFLAIFLDDEYIVKVLRLESKE